MSSLAGRPVLTAAAMRAAETQAIAAGSSVSALMEGAGAGVAAWTARLAGGAPVLVLCGPGNNGGDGYVAARLLREHGVPVRVAALAAPRTDAARAAANAWNGPVVAPGDVGEAPVVVDALLGTGANRPLAHDAVRSIRAARLAIAVDLPSGLDADNPNDDGAVAPCHVTLALGALKPAHVLQPGTRLCGSIRTIDLGLAIASKVTVLGRPDLAPPRPDAHKYTRGMVVVVGGAMPGAAILAGEAALRAGAGYVAVLDGAGGGPAALVHRAFTPEALAEGRIGCVLVGPGRGRDRDAQAKLDAALASGRALVIDGDALRLPLPETLPAGHVITPHAGEFDALFGPGEGSKLDRTIAAAQAINAVVVHKGSDTVIAAPDGTAVVAPAGNSWLSTAGSGDVLAGAIAAQLASGSHAAMDAACAGVWLHARAAAALGGGFIADDLARALSQARADA